MTVSCRWHLLQLGVLGFGLFQDVDVGVFPEGKEILISGTGLGCVSLHGVSAGESEAGQRSPWKVHHQSPGGQRTSEKCVWGLIGGLTRSLGPAPLQRQL
jgi:hypothetical protein